MQVYKTVKEVKENLPEILERIKHCRLIAETESYIMQLGIKMFVWEFKWSVDLGWEASYKAAQESYKNWFLYLQEAEYLQGLVDKLKLYKQHNI